jgi:hypothetical protein
MAAVDGECIYAGLYNLEARDYERPVIFIEFGYRLPNDIPVREPIPFESQNPLNEA